MFLVMAREAIAHKCPLNFAVVKCRPSSRQGATPNVTVTNYNEDVEFSCPLHQSFDPFNYKDNKRIVKCLGNNSMDTFTGNCQGKMYFNASFSKMGRNIVNIDQLHMSHVCECSINVEQQLNNQLDNPFESSLVSLTSIPVPLPSLTRILFVLLHIILYHRVYSSNFLLFCN